MPSEYKMDLTPKTLENADAAAKVVLERAQAQVGFVPNIYSGMVNVPGLLDTYLYGYARFRDSPGMTPVEKEVVLLSISREEACGYCVAAHSTIADQMAKVPAEVTDAIRDGRDIPDTKLAALSAFTRTMVVTRGVPSRSEVEAFLGAGYGEHQILDIILAIGVKSMSIYFNHLYHAPIDEEFAARVWQEG